MLDSSSIHTSHSVTLLHITKTVLDASERAMARFQGQDISLHIPASNRRFWRVLSGFPPAIGIPRERNPDSSLAEAIKRAVAQVLPQAGSVQVGQIDRRAHVL